MPFFHFILFRIPDLFSCHLFAQHQSFNFIDLGVALLLHHRDFFFSFLLLFGRYKSGLACDDDDLFLYTTKNHSANAITARNISKQIQECCRIVGIHDLVKVNPRVSGSTWQIVAQVEPKGGSARLDVTVQSNGRDLDRGRLDGVD